MNINLLNEIDALKFIRPKQGIFLLPSAIIAMFGIYQKIATCQVELCIHLET